MYEAGKWYPVDLDRPCNGQKGAHLSPILLATSHTVLGMFSGRKLDRNEDVWFIDDSLYDGDELPVWWMILPPLPMPVPGAIA